MSISKQEFTDAGRSMLGRAQNGETLTISSLVVGSGSAGQPSDLWPLTALIAHELNVPINSKNDDGQGQLLVEGVFRSDAAPHAFDLHEVGVMAHIGAEADRLYSVANAFTDPVDHIDPASPVFYGYKIKLIIDRIPEASLVIQIGPTDAVMGENVGSGSVGPGPFKEAVGNLLRFKRFEAGEGITIGEDAAQNKITISARLLTAENVDLYVPETYVNPPPGTLPEQFFHTVQQAHDYLLQFTIPVDKLATIHVDGGHFTQTVPINFTHPDSNRIKVVGRDPITKTVSGSITRAGTLPNLDITIPVPNTTGIAVNDVVYLYDAPHAQLESCGYVTQLIGSTSIKVRMHVENVLPPASIGAIPTTKVIVLPTQFTTSMNSGSLFSCPNSINQLKNIAMRSTTAQKAYAVNINGTGALENLFAVQFQIGFGISGGVTKLTPIVSANACSVGISAGPSGAIQLLAPVGIYDRFTFSGNLTYGIWITGGSYTTAADGSKTYACSNSTGIRSDTRGWVGVASQTQLGGFIVGYNDVGASAHLLGIVQTSINVESGIQLNEQWDLLAQTGGQISLIHNSTMSGLYSPALNTLGPSGGYVTIGSLNP
jgi:hypothetical protein